MTHANIDNSRARGMINETARLAIVHQIAIAANITLVSGMAYLLAFDPASTDRNVTLYTPAVTALSHEHEIVNYSTGTGNLLIKSPAAAAIGSIPPGGRALVRYFNGAWSVFMQLSQGTGGQFNTVAAKQTLSLYTTLVALVNSQILAVNVPFAFTLTAARFRPRVPATTAAKLATLTAGIAATGTGALTNCTGGVISLTSATMTPTNTPLAGTSVTALNTGVAGACVGVTVSAVTAFVEGDGYLEMDVLNTSLAA